MKHEDRRKYFHWKKGDLLSELLAMHKKMVKVYSISSSDIYNCNECPNKDNKPIGDGCGIETCLDQIENILKQEKKCKKTETEHLKE